MDGRDEDIWREPESGSTPTSHYWQAYSRIEDYGLKASINAEGEAHGATSMNQNPTTFFRCRLDPLVRHLFCSNGRCPFFASSTYWRALLRFLAMVTQYIPLPSDAGAKHALSETHSDVRWSPSRQRLTIDGSQISGRLMEI